jgi:hypothetical protein
MPHGEGPLGLGLGEFEAINSVSLRNHYYGRNVDTNVDAARLEACATRGLNRSCIAVVITS